MARGTNSSKQATSNLESRSANSEIGTGKGLSIGDFASPRDSNAGAFNTPTAKTLGDMNSALAKIRDTIIPQSKKLSESPETRRYLSVFNDDQIGDKEVARAVYDAPLNERLSRNALLQRDNATPTEIITNIGNSVMKDAFTAGRNDFSGFAIRAFDTLNRKYGQKVAGELVSLGLREGLDRMKRAGLSYRGEITGL